MKNFDKLIDESIDLQEATMPAGIKKGADALKKAGFMTRFDSVNYQVDIMKKRGIFHGLSVYPDKTHDASVSKFYLMDTSNASKWKEKTGSQKDVIFSGSLAQVVKKAKSLIDSEEK